MKSLKHTLSNFTLTTHVHISDLVRLSIDDKLRSILIDDIRIYILSRLNNINPLNIFK